MLAIIACWTILLIFAATLLSIVFSRKASKGCPRCGRFSGLTPRNNGFWCSWLTLFHDAIHNAQCTKCHWRGRLR